MVPGTIMNYVHKLNIPTQKMGKHIVISIPDKLLIKKGLQAVAEQRRATAKAAATPVPAPKSRRTLNPVLRAHNATRRLGKIQEGKNTLVRLLDKLVEVERLLEQQTQELQQEILRRSTPSGTQ